MTRKIPTTERFQHRGWSIRRYLFTAARSTQERPGYGVWFKGQRSSGSYNRPITRIVQSSDGLCWLLCNESDARTEFWAALDLAIDRIEQRAAA